MVQNGMVVSVETNMAVVRFERSEACAQCRACAMGKKENHDVRIENVCGAKAGDWVQVELHADKFVKASAVMYVFPLGAFMLGLLAAPRLAERVSLQMDAEVFSCIMALLLMAAAFGVIRLSEKKRRLKGEFSPKMIKIIQPEKEL